MIARMVGDFGIDPHRIFVTGLSAGGAMASVLLATYPEVFAGGAIIAGLPYGCATSVQEAFEAMLNELVADACFGRSGARRLGTPGALAQGFGLARHR